jgi:hypothetical protein
MRIIFSNVWEYSFLWGIIFKRRNRGLDKGGGKVDFKGSNPSGRVLKVKKHMLGFGFFY